MANSTISVTFKVTDADGSWKKLSGDAEGFKKIVESTLQPVDNLQKKVINWTAASQSLSNLQSAMTNLQGVMSGYTKAYEEQIQNEVRLTTVMKQRMNATDADVESMKRLASAQQEQGIIGDEVQLAGMQQVATFINQKSSLEKLTPAMNNLIAQQKGYSATASDAQSVGNLLGKAMQGNVSALQRVGITFSEAEAKVIKYGTEEERAAMLAQVIQNNVGNMNQTLAQTDAGQATQAANALGDMKEQVGAMMEPIAGVVAGLSQMGFMVTNITQLATSFAAVGTALKSVVSLQGLHAVAAKASAAATATWTAAQTLLNAILSANPIGLVVIAVTALVGALVLAYKNSESFRQICAKVFTIGKNLASMVWDKLCKAFQWLGEKLKVVWNFIKGIFGIKSDPFTNLTSGAGDAGKALDDLVDKYENYNDKTGGGKTPKVTTPKTAKETPFVENATTIKDLQSNVSILETKLNSLTAGTEEYTQTVRQLAAEQQKLSNANAFKNDSLNFAKGNVGKGISIMPKMDLTSSFKEIKKLKLPKAITKIAGYGDDTKSSWQAAARAIQQASGAMSGLGSPVLDVMGTIAQAVAAIGLAYAENLAGDNTTKGNIWAFIAAAAAATISMVSTIASLKSATAFADGGVIYGPTLGLMGEYSGASNNPEVVAPLNKLRSIIGDTQGGGATGIVGRVRGRDLILCTANESRIASKSGRRTNIKI